MFDLRILDDVAFKDQGLPNNSFALWMPAADYKKLLAQSQIDSRRPVPVYAKVQCKQSIKYFTVFLNIQPLHPDIVEKKLYLHTKALPSDVVQDGQADVEVTILNEKSLPAAHAITIKLNPKEVAIWGEDEIAFAQENVRLNKVFYKQQPIVIKSATKKATIGVVSEIYPNKQNLTAYRIDDNTIINFVGLPENKQKVIDFSEIGGLDNIVTQLREIIQIPLMFPGLLKQFNITPPRGMILYGPPGNGKTMIARAVAQSLGAKFISIQGPELISKYAGDSERRLRETFDEAYAAEHGVIFIDELDSIAINRDKTDAEHLVSMVSTLLNLMDGMSSSANIFVVGATNRLNSIDPALRRPGRFELEYLVPVPNLDARYDILQKTLKIKQHNHYADIDDDFVMKLSQLTNGYSGADLKSLHRQSVMRAIRRNIDIDEQGKIFLTTDASNIKLTQEDFYESYKKITPTSIRSYDVVEQPVLWDEVLGLSCQKQHLMEIHQLTSKLSNSLRRPSFFNLLFQGKKGSGRSTLIHAFAKQFNYEIIVFDILNHSYLEYQELLNEISDVIKTCKQASPSVVYFKNLSQHSACQNLVYFISSQLDRLNSKDIVLSVVECEDEKNAEIFQGYKLFNEYFDFSNVLDSDKEAIFTQLKNQFNEEKVRHFVFDENLPTGQLITQLEEEQVRGI